MCLFHWSLKQSRRHLCCIDAEPEARRGQLLVNSHAAKNSSGSERRSRSWLRVIHGTGSLASGGSVLSWKGNGQGEGGFEGHLGESKSLLESALGAVASRNCAGLFLEGDPWAWLPGQGRGQDAPSGRPRALLEGCACPRLRTSTVTSVPSRCEQVHWSPATGPSRAAASPQVTS